MPLRIKRIYEPASPDDGIRILVDRIWPRGISHGDARLDDWIKEHTDKARGRAHELLSEIAGTLGPDCVSHFREGKPQEEIVACAEEIKADMIVMGSHGYRGLSRMVLGSVTEYVLRHSECPVVAVKHKKAE